MSMAGDGTSESPCLLAANIAASTWVRHPKPWRQLGLVSRGRPAGLAGWLHPDAAPGNRRPADSLPGRDRPDGLADPPQSTHAAFAPRHGSAIHRARFLSRTGGLAEQSAAGFRQGGRQGNQGVAILPSRPLPAGVGRRSSRARKAGDRGCRVRLRTVAGRWGGGVCPSSSAVHPLQGK